MIETLRFHHQHTLLGLITEGLPALKEASNQLVHSVAIGIFAQIGVSISLFYLHHNLFAFGFVIGFIFDKQVRVLVKKVNVVYEAHRTFVERGLFYTGGFILTALTMPTSLIIASLYYSAQWGAILYKSSQARYHPSAPPIIPLEEDVSHLSLPLEEDVSHLSLPLLVIEKNDSNVSITAEDDKP